MQKRVVGSVFLLLILTGSLFSYKVLFDYTKDETAGNSDWVIDRDFPYPQPANPQGERDWDGAFSAFGYAIYSQMHDTVATLHSYPITYNDNSNPLDLSNFDVFIVPEPQNPFTESEKQAIKSFVQAGGGLFLISDHNGSDRNHSGWDSPRVFNDLGTETLFGVHYNITGDPNNSFSEVSSNVTDTQHPVISGPFGNVSALSYHSGTSLALHPEDNSNVRGLIFRTNSTSACMFAVSTYGRGRVALMGDSSPFDDGTGDSHDHLYNGWNESGTSHSILALNAVKWLEGQEDSSNAPVNFVMDGIIDSVATLAVKNGSASMYCSNNDSLVYIGIKYNPQNISRLYIFVSDNPGSDVPVPWARGGNMGKYDYYLVHYTGSGLNYWKNQYQIIDNAAGLSCSNDTNHVVECVLNLKNAYNSTSINSINIFVVGFSTDGGGTVNWTLPSANSGQNYEGSNFYTLSLNRGADISRNAYAGQSTYTTYMTTDIKNRSNVLIYNCAGRKMSGKLHRGIYFLFDRKTKKIRGRVIILR